jgi:flagellar hook assembly protein FlgD
LIKTLVSKVLEPGTSTIQWDGTDANGNKLPGGIYLSRLISENFAETKRLIFIK